MERPTYTSLADRDIGPALPAIAPFAVAGLVLSAAAVWVALSGAGPEPRWLAATAHALVIAVPIGAGLYALHTLPAPANRFGRLLLLAGLLWSPTMLAESADSVLYSIGRVWVWLAEVLLVYVVLAFPSGRLASSVDRLLFRAALLVVGVLFLPTALLVEQFPTPNPWSSCGSDCPPNAFMVVGSEPGFVDAIVTPLAQAGSLVVLVGVAVLLALRITRGSRLMRMELMPVLTVAVVRMAGAAAFLVSRHRAPQAQLTDALGLVALLGTPALSAGFLIGLVRSRRSAARALTRLGWGLGGRPSAADLRDVIAEAVHDPSLEVVYWTAEDPGGWVDADGEPAVLPFGVTGRAVTEVRGSGGAVAALVHDSALADAPVMTEVAGGFALMALENQRLDTQLRSSLHELHASRARILSAADRERARIERDLHDGAQQRLVALGIQLELAGDLVEGQPEKAAGRLRELAMEVDEAVDEVRTLAQGLVPPLLAERGPVEALRAAAAGGPLPTTVHARGIGRYAHEIENAVYFCCLEALQNAGKHAAGARSVSVTLWEDEELRFEVRDDGEGLPDGWHQSGAGLTNMRDRIGAVGGRLAIESLPGEGTCVAGVVPIASVEWPPQVEQLLQRATEALEDCFGVYRAVRDARGEVVDFVVEHVNEAACLDMGFTREELVGRTLGQLLPGYPRSRALHWHREVLEQGTTDSREELSYEGVLGDRRRLRRAYDVRAAPLGGGRLVLTWRDVTDHKRMEQQLRLLSTVLGRAAEGVLLVRASDGTIVYANPRFAAILGYEPGELDGRPVAEIHWEDEPGGAERLAREIMERLEAGGEASFEIRNRRKDGSAIWCEAHVAAFDHPDHGRLWVAVQQDVTARRRAERRRAEAALRGDGEKPAGGVRMRWTHAAGTAANPGQASASARSEGRRGA
jgi:PAS domain S-box-containing protein